MSSKSNRPANANATYSRAMIESLKRVSHAHGVRLAAVTAYNLARLISYPAAPEDDRVAFGRLDRLADAAGALENAAGSWHALIVENGGDIASIDPESLQRAARTYAVALSLVSEDEILSSEHRQAIGQID